LNRLAERADLERHVHADVQPGVDLHAGLGDWLEAGEHRRDLILTDRHVREGIKAGFVGDCLARDLRPDVGERDVHARQDGPGGVLHHTGDVGRVELRVCRRRTHHEHTDNEGDAPGHDSSRVD
jgi:hypothetical protein